MLLKLFLIFLKINFLSTSGPASIGISQKLLVPNFISQDSFNRIIAISTGIPGSDAVQIAWQVGYELHGFLGALVALCGALIPSILMVTLVLIGIKFISPDILSKFFNGINPALAVFLIITALTLIPTQFSIFSTIIILLSFLMFFIKIPLVVILIICGVIGIIFL